MSKITYADKVQLNTNSSTADINKGKAENWNSVKKAVNENGSYSTTTAGSTAGQFYCTLEGTLSTNDIVRVNVPTNSSTNNASLSIDGGITYYNIIDSNGNNIKSKFISNQNIQLYFNGTNFILDTIFGGKILWINNNPTTAISSDTNITLSSNNYNMILWLVRYSQTITEIISSVSIKGYGAKFSNILNDGATLRYREITYNSDTSYTIKGVTNGGALIPIYAIGIKNNLFS